MSADAPSRTEARARRIALLAEAVARGRYRADPRAVAEAMLRAAAGDLLQ